MATPSPTRNMSMPLRMIPRPVKKDRAAPSPEAGTECGQRFALLLQDVAAELDVTLLHLGQTPVDLGARLVGLDGSEGLIQVGRVPFILPVLAPDLHIHRRSHRTPHFACAQCASEQNTLNRRRGQCLRAGWLSPGKST